MNAPFRLDAANASILGTPRATRAVLMLAHAHQAPYRVMRCLAATGAEVHVLAGPQARSLGLSRFCKNLRNFPLDPAPNDDVAIARIEAYCESHGIEMVLPADAVATRFLASIRDRLSMPVFPIPDLKTFDQLATKDRFMAFCRERAIRHPEGRLLANREALKIALANGCIRLPAIVKPIDRWGGLGVIRIDEHNAQEIAAKIDYAPILVQDYIEGADRSISIFAIRGRVTKQVAYCYPDGAFTFAAEPELARIVGGIAADLSLDGVFNFDARIETDGSVWLLECNPRFFFTMDAAMVAGANFTKIEDEGVVIGVADGELRQPEALLKHLARGRLPNMRDWKMLAHWLRDPLYFGLAVAGYKRRWNAPRLERLFARD
ncbi:MAG TPA: ATP-grasp domain-containing protein [Rhizomicrobium sp.]|jgi:predicted ATP-grasp superfamily ATP-dependent carboligase